MMMPRALISMPATDGMQLNTSYKMTTKDMHCSFIHEKSINTCKDIIAVYYVLD